MIVLDGVTAPPHGRTGCRHDPVWLVRSLGAALAGGLLAGTSEAPREVLANAIAEVRDSHAHTCDLTTRRLPPRRS